MRFPRQARIFRGQLDPAPFAAVVFLLVIFLQLSSLIHTPGVLIQMKNPPAKINPAAIIYVEADGSIRFGGNTYGAAETNRLMEALKNSTVGPPFDVRVAAGASTGLAAQVKEMVTGLFPIELPEGSTNQMIWTKNPTVVVAVNFLGQYFFENQIMGEQTLTNRLRNRVLAAARNSQDLTLLVWADKRVDFNAVDRLEQWAAEAGVAEVAQVERATAPGASPGIPLP